MAGQKTSSEVEEEPVENLSEVSSVKNHNDNMRRLKMAENNEEGKNEKDEDGDERKRSTAVAPQAVDHHENNLRRLKMAESDEEE